MGCWLSESPCVPGFGIGGVSYVLWWPSRNKMKVFAPSGRPEQLWGAAADSDMNAVGWRLGNHTVEITPGPACWDKKLTG